MEILFCAVSDKPDSWLNSFVRRFGFRSSLAERRADRRQPLGQLLLEAAVDGAIVFAVDAEIVLRGDGAGRIVSVFIAGAVTEALARPRSAYRAR